LSVLEKIAYFQNRRDEVPNQNLAKELAETENRADIRIIAQNLWNKNKNIQSDCLKVLYEIGYIKPDLIVDHVGDFLKLLKSKNNRAVWGAMIALATITDKKPLEIYDNIADVIAAVEQGSLITVVWGVPLQKYPQLTAHTHRKSFQFSSFNSKNASHATCPCTRKASSPLSTQTTKKPSSQLSKREKKR
jgi:hypothetical protein